MLHLHAMNDCTAKDSNIFCNNVQDKQAENTFLKIQTGRISTERSINCSLLSDSNSPASDSVKSEQIDQNYKALLFCLLRPG